MRQQPQQLPQWSRQELAPQQSHPVQHQPVFRGAQVSSQQIPQAGAQSASQQTAQQSAQSGQQVGAQGSMGQPMVQTTQPQAREPPVDVLETPEELIVLVDMAGFDEDDIQLDVDNDVLRIAASRTLEIDDDETLLAQERPARFERYLQLPVEADIEDAKAKHKDGVCRITLPKSEQARGNHHRIGFQ